MNEEKCIILCAGDQILLGQSIKEGRINKVKHRRDEKYGRIPLI